MTFISPYAYPGIKLHLLSRREKESLKSTDPDAIEILRKIVEEYFWIDMNKKCRRSEYKVPRFIYFFLCRKYTKKSYEEIGESVGLDHTTIIHGYNTITGWLETDDMIDGVIKELELQVLKAGL